MHKYLFLYITNIRACEASKYYRICVRKRTRGSHCSKYWSGPQHWRMVGIRYTVVFINHFIFWSQLKASMQECRNSDLSARELSFADLILTFS